MRRMVRRIVGASASPVAAGGESGWWQWLLPCLVVLVVAFAGLSVRHTTVRSHRTTEVAARASTFLSSVQDARAASGGPQAERARDGMFAALSRLELHAGSDSHVAILRPAANAAARKGDNARWMRLVSLSTTARDDLDAAAAHAEAESRRLLSIALGGGGLLALLLMWTFWAKRTRIALARNERRFHSLTE